MNSAKIQVVIAELFEKSGTLGNYRQKFTDTCVEDFLGKKSVRLADAIIRELGEHFEAYVASANQQEYVNGAGSSSEVGEQQEADLVRPVMSEAGAPLTDGVDSGAEPSETPVAQELAPAIKELAEEVQNGMPSAASAPAPKAAPLSHASPADGVGPQKPLPAPTGRGDSVPRKFSFRLKGGKLQSGVSYEGRIESVDGAPGAAAHVLGVQLPSDIGLMCDTADPSRIIGTPTVGGDFSIGLTYRIEGPSTDQMVLASSISVFINHDPKSLWKDLPSDKDDQYWKPDVDSDLQQGSGRRMIAASKRGRSHAHEGKFRDDDFRIVCSDESGWTVIAVADGAGSAAKSRRGSQIAVERAVDVLLENLAGEDGLRLENSIAAWHEGLVSRESVISSGLYPLLGVAAFEACKAIEVEAAATGVAAKEYSTTLLITAYKQLAVGHLFATYWVGDGGVGIYRSDAAPELLGLVDSGEFAGQTRFLDRKVMTTEEIAARLNFALVDGFEALIAMTDGITDPWFMTDNNLESAEYWGKLWSEIEPALNAKDPQAALLSWLDFWSPGNHDDRTIAVLW